MDGSIVAADEDRAQQWRLKFDNLEEFPAAIECSRDGTRAAYIRHDSQTREGIVRITDETGERVLRLDGVVSGVSWSPDGKYLAVTRTDFETLTNELLINADNDEQQSLTSGSGTIGAPRWSPDGAA
jgi:Tol biopolymer transport system component